MFKNSLVFFILVCGYGYTQNNVARYVDSLTFVKNNEDKVRIGKTIASKLKDSDWNRALYYLDYAIEVAKASESEQLLVETYKTAGNIYFEKEALDVALDYYQKAYDYYEAEHNTDELFILENNLAIIYAQLKNKKESLKHFKKVYHYQLKKKDSIYLAQVLNNIGTLYLETEVDSSLVYYNKSLKLAQGLNNEGLNVYLYTNLARCFTEKKEFKTAEGYFYKALNLLKKDNTLPRAWVYNQLAEYYLRTAKSDSAIYYATKTIDLQKDNPYTFTNQKAVKTLYKSYVLQEDYKKATESHEWYDVISDSLNIVEKTLNVEKIKLQQEYKAKAQIYNLKEKQKQFKYYTIGLSLVVCVLILGLILLRYRSKLQKAKLKNELIASKAKELDANLELKNKELVAKAMTEIHRAEITQDILKDLKHIKLKAVKKETQNAIDYILKRLESESQTNIWKEFEVRFEQVHESFYKNLKEKHPDLTSRDKRLCALLKLNLTSKEIAQITGQSFKSVENSRTRLRKKLELTNSRTDLAGYLNNLSEK